MTWYVQYATTHDGNVTEEHPNQATAERREHYLRTQSGMTQVCSFEIADDEGTAA